MRKKSVTVLTIVYLALCVSYGAASANLSQVKSDDTYIIQSEASQISTDTSSEKDEFTESITILDTQSDTESNTQTKKDTSQILSKPESTIQTDSEEEINSDQEEMTDTQEPVIEEQEENNEEEYIEEEQNEPEQQIPTLEEFLQRLRCSGCRHNCSLLSPRCMNGARKAANAENEYYAIYG